MSFFKDTKSSSTNTALGVDALNAITSGSGNVALGPNAGALVTTATNIICIGPNAADAITITVDDVIAIGSNAVGAKTTAGNHVIGIGKGAGSALTTGANNVLVGYNTGNSITTASNNTIIGHLSDIDGATYGGTTIVGHKSYGKAYSTCVGYKINQNKTLSGYFIAIGYGTARSTTNTGYRHTLLGVNAGRNMSGTNNDNTFIGYRAGWYSSGVVTTTGYNIAIGKLSGQRVSGKGSIYIGHTAGGEPVGARTGNRTIAIGQYAGRNSILTVNDTIAIGYKAGYVLTSGADNILIGPNAGDAITTAANNIAIGRDALGVKSTTGNANIGIGKGAGSALTTGDNNVLIGYNTGNSIATFSGNTIIGHLSDMDGATGGNTTIIGYKSYGKRNSVVLGAKINLNKTLGNYSIAIGYNAAFNSTDTGYGHMLIGYDSGANMTGTQIYNMFIGPAAGRWSSGTGSWNLCVGHGAGFRTSTSFNVYIGYRAGGWTAGARTGQRTIAIGKLTCYSSFMAVNDTIAIGYKAGFAITSGADNILIGPNAGDAITTAANNIAIGRDALGAKSTTGNNNIGIGKNAGSALSTGANNILIGYNAGISLGIGSRSVLIGSKVDTIFDVNDSISIGYKSYSSSNDVHIGGYVNTLKSTGGSNVCIGTNVCYQRGILSDSVVIGIGAGSNMAGSNNVCVGRYAGFYTTGTKNVYLGAFAGPGNAPGATGSRTIAIGYNACRNSVLTVNDTIAIGYKAGYVLTSGFNNILIGPNAGDAMTTAANNIAIGRDALGAKSTTGNDNIAIGKSAGAAMTTGANNVLVGYNTGNSITTLSKNTIIGHLSDIDGAPFGSSTVVGYKSYGKGYSVCFGARINTGKTLGGYSVIIGCDATKVTTNTGKGHVIIGCYTARNMSGTNNYNVFIGYRAGYSTAGLSGTTGYNIGIGKYSGRNTAGKSNIYVGYRSGAQASVPTGNNTIAIGYKAVRNSVLTVNDTIAIGYKAGYVLTTSASTISIGKFANQALAANASESIAIGVSSATRGYQSIAMGSSSYASETPVSQVQTVTTTDAASITDGAYFWLFSTTVSYYFWYRKNPPNTVVDPNPAVPAGFPVTKSSQMVVISSTATANQVASTTQAVINALTGVFSAPVPGANVITVTNTVPGYVGSPGNGLVGITFTFAITAIGKASPKTIAIGSGSIAKTGTIVLDAFPEIPRQSGYANIAIGKGARAIGASVIAIGENAGGLDAVSYNMRYDQIIMGRNALSATPTISLGVNLGAVCIGANAMQSSVNSYGAVCIGANAMKNATAIGNRSVVIGSNALLSNCGDDCVAIGNSVSMTSNYVAGSVIIGRSANCGSANNVVAVGRSSTGTSAGAVAVGYYASVTAVSAIAIGGNAQSQATGTIAIGGGSSSGTGGNAAFCNANFSIAIGSNTKITNTSATYCTAVGRSITIGSAWTNSMALGNGAVLAASNQIQMGNASITSFRCAVAPTIGSDERLKRDIEPCDIGLEFISRMQPKKFNLIADEPTKQTKRFGFIAQDVRDLINETNHTDFGVLHYDETTDRYSMDYIDLIAPTIKALQDMKRIIDIQQETINTLLQRVAVLENK